MRRLVTWLLVALIGSTSVGWAQQRLPGPAEQGWFVVIGENPFVVWLRKNPSSEGAAFMSLAGFCKAKVIRAADQLNITASDPTAFGGPDVVDFAAEPKRYGPYNSRPDALAALAQSGWNVNLRSEIVFSDSGCLTKAEEQQRDKELTENAAKLRQQKEAEAVARQAKDKTEAERKPPAPPRSVDAMVDDVLKNKQSPQPQVTRQAPAAPNLAAVVTASEIEGVRNKIRPCWTIKSGGRHQNMIVTLVVQMNRDGTPVKAEVRDTGRYNNDPNFRAAADAAHRAVMNPRCQPWPLSPEKYESWRSFTFNFDPRDY